MRQPNGLLLGLGRLGEEVNAMALDVLQTVRASVAELLGVQVSDVDVCANLFDLGLDSFSVIELVSILRAKYGFSLGPREVFENPSVGGLVVAIEFRASGDQRQWR